MIVASISSVVSMRAVIVIAALVIDEGLDFSREIVSHGRPPVCEMHPKRNPSGASAGTLADSRRLPDIASANTYQTARGDCPQICPPNGGRLPRPTDGSGRPSGAGGHPPTGEAVLGRPAGRV
jgi:hypothetical protein